MSTTTIPAGLTAVGTKQLFVETAGVGPDVVLVHGLGGTTSFFEPLVASLAERFRVTRYDFSGHGRSPLAGELTLESLTAELALIVESQTVSGRAHLVGHSMGTLMVQQLASTRPDLVQNVALGPVRQQAQAAKDATRARAALVREHGMAAVADTVANAATADHAAIGNPLVRPFVRELLLGQDPGAYAQACEALADATNPDLTAIQSKVLLLTGSEDKVSTPVSNEAMAAELGSAELLVAPGTGHWTVPESPDFVTAAVLDFLTSTTRTPATKKTCACSNAGPGCQSRRQQAITMQIRKTT
ncbi:alpha/beta fold hydrolase [Arthrobacter sp. MI7-26]|uniref:alpha/beta fold hydrolase n=1 Tax=Arthrobacter sp. MI7-26 TaxID=2993653 RepID=UPI0022499F09|nr:alpha/beta fold hydrolase [Arthrobacter sp. MI7-26]MCX2750007.1 alpha/beta fold hydrolase [Arthrobacter sp. MI7-26]